MGHLKSLDSRSPSRSSSQQMVVPVAQAEDLSVSLGFSSFIPSHLNHRQNLSHFPVRVPKLSFLIPRETPDSLSARSSFPTVCLLCYTAAEGPLTDKVRCHHGPKPRSPHLRQTSRRGALAWPCGLGGLLPAPCPSAQVHELADHRRPTFLSSGPLYHPSVRMAFPHFRQSLLRCHHLPAQCSEHMSAWQLSVLCCDHLPSETVTFIVMLWASRTHLWNR